MRLPESWEILLNPHLNMVEFYNSLDKFIEDYEILIPGKDLIFNAFHLSGPDRVKCVLYGEDPYPRISSACGIAFWDKEVNSWEDKTNGNSLKNMLKAMLTAEEYADYRTPIVECRKIARGINFKAPGKLFTHWIDQGIFLLNTSLTFSTKMDKKAHFMFWRPFQKAVIKSLNKREESPVYILWGNKAGNWEKDILESIDDSSKIIRQGHPTFIHQFMDPENITYSPFHDIIRKTGLDWV
ncbi:MAG: uracil-DNA glycosylase family protein [Calditrichaceae bacterium]